jgi:hypothetical protein
LLVGVLHGGENVKRVVGMCVVRGVERGRDLVRIEGHWVIGSWAVHAQSYLRLPV